MRESGAMDNQYKMAPLVSQASGTNILSRLSIFGALLVFGFFWARPAQAASLTLTFNSDPSGIALGGSGELSVGPASPAGFEPTSRAQVIGGKTWTVPVLANGLLLVRNSRGDVVCLDLH